MNSAAPFAVIFDVDGVLIDSNPAVHRVRTRLMARRGVDMTAIPDPHGEGHKGSSLSQILAAVKEHTGIELDPDEFAHDFATAMRAELKATQVDAGLVAFLRDLRHHHIPCAIASNGRPESIGLKLDILGIRDSFDEVVSAADIDRHKPDPQIYLLAADRLGLPPARCIVIEDSAQGVAAGQAAGCHVVGFSKYNDDRHAPVGADMTVNDWSELSYKTIDKVVEKL